MIEEQGCVVGVEQGAVWVETLRKSACSGCSNSVGCGQGLMDRLGVRGRHVTVRALSNLQLRVGDVVVIGVREGFLVRGSFLVYLLPLLGIFSCSVLAQEFGLDEPLVILAGVLGFGFACGMVGFLSWHAKDDLEAQPRVLQVIAQ